MTAETVERGHRPLAHTADQIVEAWGPTREACLEEAALGLVETFAQPHGVGWCDHTEVVLTGSDEDLLVGLLEEIIYRLDTDRGVPVRVRVRPRGDRVRVDLWLTERGRLAELGVAPKGVAYSQLQIGPDAAGLWRCRVTIDV